MQQFRIIWTSEFEKWFSKLQRKQQAVIEARFKRLGLGHFGDHKRFQGLIELRWKNGTRIYIFNWGEAIIVALYGGNKNDQKKDINKTIKIRNEIFEGIRSVKK